MSSELSGKTIAILATDGFEQTELFGPKEILEKAGAKVVVLSVKEGEIKAWDVTDWGKTIRVDVLVREAKPEQYDALVLPGGVMNPDKLRIDPLAVGFIKKFVESGKPAAAICHASWTLIEAGVVKGKTVTSWPSLKTDLVNAGAKWVDQEVVTDGNLIFSRKPQDVPAFSRAILEAIGSAKGSELKKAS
jgi:protease I